MGAHPLPCRTFQRKQMRLGNHRAWKASRIKSCCVSVQPVLSSDLSIHQKAACEYHKRPFKIFTLLEENNRVGKSSTGNRFLVKTEQSVGFRFLQALHNAFLVDITDALGGNAQSNPSVFFGNVEFLNLQIGIEFATGFDVGVGNIVPGHHFLSGYFTNFRHGCKYF